MLSFANFNQSILTMRKYYADGMTDKRVIVGFAFLIVLVIVGPFGTYEQLTLSERFVYWTVLMMGIGLFMAIFISAAVESPSLSKMSIYFKLAIGSGLAAIPGTAVLIFVKRVFEMDGADSLNPALLAVQIAAVGWLYGLVEHLDWRKPHTDTVAPSRPMPEAITTRFHARLDHDTGHNIISLSMQDHYVEVTTDTGRQMILMRMSDALAELDALPGLRIHRSHWIATAHLDALHREGGKPHARLSDGRSLPISKPNVTAVSDILDQRENNS